LNSAFLDTDVTTIIEFCCSAVFVDELFVIFSKAEDGCMSHGLGNKAGGTVSRFNAAIASGLIVFRVVFVRRLVKKKKRK
jgi:hypothetical protein